MLPHHLYIHLNTYIHPYVYTLPHPSYIYDLTRTYNFTRTYGLLIFRYTDILLFHMTCSHTDPMPCIFP